MMMSSGREEDESSRRIPLLLIATLLLGPGVAPGAEKPPRDPPTAPGIQRERVSLILVDVVVTDGNGLPVEDLRPEDFTLLVDGRPVKLQSVDLQVVDLATPAASATHPVPPGSQPPPRAPEPPPPSPTLEPPNAIQRIPRGRGIVLFFDGLNCERGLGPESIRSARNFLREGLRLGDEVMVVGLGRVFKVYQDFTPDLTVALSALDRVEKDPLIRKGGENHTWSNLERLADMAEFLCNKRDIGQCAGRGAMPALGEAFASEDLRRTSRFFAVLGALTGVLRAREGRKEVFLFSDGFPLDPEAIYLAPEPNGKTGDLLRASREASSAQVVLNPVSTLGLTGPDRGLGARPQDVMRGSSTATLSGLALGTGGVLIHGTNSRFEGPMRSVEEQTRATYQLAYAPEGEPDGKLHSTRVVVRRKDLQVRTQEGFLWMTETQRRERETLSAYAAPELFRAIPVSLLVRTYLENNGKPMVEVAIALSESSLLLLPREGRRAVHLEAGGVLRSTDGKVEQRFSRRVEARLPKKTDHEAGGITLLARRPVPPGEYEAVAVVRDLASGEVGAARMPVKVPALSLEHLAMSSLVFSLPTSAPSRIDLDRPGSEQRLLKVPAVTPVFSAGDTVNASCVLYHPRRDPVSHEASVILQAAIHGSKSGTRQQLSLRHRIPARDTRNSFPIEFPLELIGLESGRYELDLEAWDEVDHRGVLQKVEFLVR